MSQTLIQEKLTPVVCQRILDKGLNKTEYVSVFGSIPDISVKDFTRVSGMSQRTLSRMKPEQKVPEQIAEATISLLRVYQKACEVFDSSEKAQEWIKRPNSSLDGKTPYEAVGNRFGAEEALSVLIRLEYGVYS